MLPRPIDLKHIYDNSNFNQEVEGGLHEVERPFFLILDPNDSWKSVPSGEQRIGMILIEYFAPSRRVNLSLQDYFADLANLKLLTGSFDISFPNLSKMDISSFDDLNLKDVRAILDKQLKENIQTIELMGIKLPTTAISLWGIIALIMMQLYFLLHLKEFVRIVDKSKSNFDLPWIGLYNNKLSRFLIFISVIILPIVVVFISYLWQNNVDLGDLLFIVSISFLLISFIISVVTYKLFTILWKQIYILNKPRYDPIKMSIILPFGIVLLSSIVIGYGFKLEYVELNSRENDINKITIALSERENKIIEKELSLKSFDNRFYTAHLKKKILTIPSKIYTKLLFENGNKNRLNDSINLSIRDELKGKNSKFMKQELTKKLNKSYKNNYLPRAITLSYLYKFSNEKIEKEFFIKKLIKFIDNYADEIYLDKSFEFWKLFHSSIDKEHIYMVLGRLSNYVVKVNKSRRNSYHISLILKSFEQLESYKNVINNFSSKSKYHNTIIIARNNALNDNLSDLRRLNALRALSGLSQEAFSVVSSKLILDGNLSKNLKKKIMNMIKSKIEEDKFSKKSFDLENLTIDKLRFWYKFENDIKKKWLEMKEVNND